MIHTLNTKAADYIPELGDGFEEGSEGSENAQGLQVADYYADADGEGIYYITYKIETEMCIRDRDWSFKAWLWTGCSWNYFNRCV